MPIFSLTEEKVEELMKLLKDKRQEYDKLLSMHVYEIWERDLENFLEALEKHEEQEEKDRLAHASTNGGAAMKKKGRRVANKQGSDKKGGKNA